MSVRQLLSANMNWQAALCIGIIAIAIFIMLSSLRLTAQGLYYDELHQATASFLYTNKYEYKETTPYMFVRARVHGLPVLNMSYSGALKTGIYGLYLRYFNPNFNVIDWRLLGIIFTSCGIFLFLVISSGRLSSISLSLFVFLLVSDITVVLATRHDWGPVALSMLIRLLFIAIWLNGETKETLPISNSFILGCLVGIGTFEKLSSVVLILPLILIFSLSHQRRTTRHWLACILGGFLGGIPLIIVNLTSFFKHGYFISFEAVTSNHPYSIGGFFTYLVNYLSLGAGREVKSFILGLGSYGYNYIECVLLSFVIIIIAIISTGYSKKELFIHLSGIMLLCYIVVGVSLYLIPKGTWVHHWVIGTPFQYAAILLAFHGFFNGKILYNAKNKLYRFILIFSVSVLLIFRLLGIVSLTEAFDRGQTSIHWDPSLSKIGYFAASRSDEAVFIAADWGLATSIFCLSNGNPDLVYELFWNYQGPEEIKALIKKSGKKICYVLSLIPQKSVNSAITSRLLRDLEKLESWREAPVEDEIAELEAVAIRKYVNFADDVR